MVETLRVDLFKASYRPFTQLLRDSDIEYTDRMPPIGVPLNIGFGLDVIIKDSAAWAALATVVCTYLKNRRGRKVIITTRDNTVIHTEGLSEAEIVRFLERARSIAAIETSRDET